MSVRPLRWLRGTGSDLPTNVTVTWADVFRPTAVLGTLDAFSMNNASAATACAEKWAMSAW